jgi:hypothetical protein
LDSAVLRIIEPPREGCGALATLVKSERLSAGRAATIQVVEAQTRAAEILAQADADALRVQKEAYREGLRLGAMAAVQPVLALLAHLDQMQTQFSQRVQAQISASVTTLLEHDVVLESLLTAALDAHKLPTGTELQVVLPASACQSVHSVQARCAASGLRAAVEVSEDYVFGISWQGHRWETQTGAYAKQAFEAAQPPHLSREDAATLAAETLFEAASGLQGLAIPPQSPPEAQEMRYRQDGLPLPR